MSRIAVRCRYKPYAKDIHAVPLAHNLSLSDVFEPRNPQESHYFRCDESHFEQLEELCDDLYVYRYGFWLSYVKEVIYRYLDCGDLLFGFARVKM
jgi:hypothetical protein